MGAESRLQLESWWAAQIEQHSLEGPGEPGRSMRHVRTTSRTGLARGTAVCCFINHEAQLLISQPGEKARTCRSCTCFL
eukprot:COSAG02_NODE_43332_length_376_cov_0.357401_1_plen_78_part_01